MLVWIDRKLKSYSKLMKKISKGQKLNHWDERPVFYDEHKTWKAAIKNLKNYHEKNYLYSFQRTNFLNTISTPLKGKKDLQFWLKFKNKKKSKVEIPERHIYDQDLMNIHNFRFFAQIWRGFVRGTNSKNKKKRPKIHSFKAVKGWNGVEKSRPPKGTSGHLLKVHI